MCLAPSNRKQWLAQKEVKEVYNTTVVSLTTGYTQQQQRNFFNNFDPWLFESIEEECTDIEGPLNLLVEQGIQV